MHLPFFIGIFVIKTMNNVPQFVNTSLMFTSDVIELTENFHNDMDLGREVRKLVYKYKQPKPSTFNIESDTPTEEKN